MNIERCEACIECEEDWSASMHLSCHDTCEKFQQWEKERQKCQTKKP